MTVRQILENIDKPNLVESVLRLEDGKDQLMRLGQYVITNHDENMSSMDDWCELVEDGMQVAKFESKGKSYPWENAANFKSPIITEAVRGFGDRAKTEIMKNKDLVSASFDIDGVEEVAERLEKHMNWQINTEMEEWRHDQTKLFYILASQGSVFKKTYFDSAEGRNYSAIVKYPNFSLDQDCKSLENSKFTEIKHYSMNECWENMNSGIWHDCDDLIEDKNQEDYCDEDFEFLEQFINYDIDNDGYAEPLLVTVHVSTAKVVRIVARYDADTVYVKYNGGNYDLKTLMQIVGEPKTNDEAFNEYETNRALDDVIKKSKLVKIKPSRILTHYQFIESTDGSFLGLGYLHVFASTVKGVNKNTNSLINAGDLSNLQGGWLSKEHRDKKRGDLRAKPGGWVQTNISATSLANSVYPFPFKEPSQTLLALNENIKEEARSVSGQFNFADALTPNIPAASVLGLMQEGVIPTSSLLMNVASAMTAEFSVIFELNKKFTDPVIYGRITGTQDFETDYAQEIEVKPTANAQHSSQFQRIQLAQAEVQMAEQVLQIGGNPIPIYKGYFEAIGSNKAEQIFSQEVPPEEQAQLEQLRQLQEQQLKATQFQNEMLQAQLQQAQQELERKVADTQSIIEERQRESDRKDATLVSDIELKQADAALAREKAESENANEQVKLGLEQNKQILEQQRDRNV